MKILRIIHLFFKLVSHTIYVLVNKFSSKNDEVDVVWSLRDKIQKSNNDLSKFLLTKKYNKYLEKYNSFIPINAVFYDKPTFPHCFYGIFISSGAIIGRNCTIFHQVTIGSNTLVDSKHRGMPTSGDNVFIGCGAKIIGNVKVGNNVRIGANCIVASDIPDNATVVLPPPKVIQHTMKRNNGFISYSNYKCE